MLLQMIVRILSIFNIPMAEIVGLPQPIVELASGSVRGFIDNSTSGKSYYGFTGIPYAKPPQRFKPPEPVEPWTEILDATKDGHICSQINAATNAHDGSEDCLTLNVYTPQIVNDSYRLLPVIINIHEGGFIAGTGAKSFHGPQNLMDYPIVLVTFNYRLGVFGFISTEDKHSHGNYGMMDQLMVLKWVQANIVKFGGDPKRVTIHGVSAGAASVMFHVLSPLSSGLFRGAIAGSGSALNPWAVKDDPKSWAITLARNLNCDHLNCSKEIIKCLTKKSSEELVVGARKLRENIYFPTDLAPVIEPNCGPGFLTEKPVTTLEEGKIANKVPVIIGFTKEEGYFFYVVLSSLFKSMGKEYFEKEFPKQAYLFSAIKPNSTMASTEVVKQYVDETVNIENKEDFVKILSKIIGDAYFEAGIQQTADWLSKAGVPTYAYIYNHIGMHCTSLFAGEKCGKHVSHGDELFLNFRIAGMGLSEADEKMASIINGLWIDFAYGQTLQINDGEKWPLYEVDKPRFVELSLKPSIKQGHLSDKMDFWTQTIPKLQ